MIILQNKDYNGNRHSFLLLRKMSEADCLPETKPWGFNVASERCPGNVIILPTAGAWGFTKPHTSTYFGTVEAGGRLQFMMRPKEDVDAYYRNKREFVQMLKQPGYRQELIPVAGPMELYAWVLENYPDCELSKRWAAKVLTEAC